MDLLLNDIKETLGARSVTLPCPSSNKVEKAPQAEVEEVVCDAVSRLRLEEGGVALPPSSATRSMSRPRFTIARRPVGAVETAG
jgi:hypothetical protein